jgi:hypothetical protein
MFRSAVVALLATLFAVQASAQAVKQVEVTNFPDPQNVSGSVTVANEPLTVQSGVDPVEVSGQVAVTNLPAGESAETFQLVGFTDLTFVGSSGMGTFTQSCQSTFGTTARMCTSPEVLDTVSWVVTPESGPGWVRPVYQPSPLVAALDLSGVYVAGQSNGFLSCSGWHS